MKSFNFQQFTIDQNSEVFRVGTDGVILGALCSVNEAQHVLEVGTGTGLISLMIAQRNKAVQILAIDISELSWGLSKGNFERSPFSSRLRSQHADFKSFETLQKFDLMVSNPPYFEENLSQKDQLARQTIELNAEQLIAKAAHLLTANGILSVIVPAGQFSLYKSIALENKLYLRRKVDIYGVAAGTVKRNIIEFSAEWAEHTTEKLVIEKSPRKYSDQYLELTREFHVFK